MTALAALAALGCDGVDVPVGPVGEPGDPCCLAAVSSDYASTSVSLLSADAKVCVDNALDSGSVAAGLSMALSGDVVLPSSPHPEGLVTLVDRYPNAVLTFLDPETLQVASQLSVGTGFASNPHDVVFLDATRAYVSRFATNPTPTADLDDLDEGGDLLVVDPSTGTLLGRVDLRAEADPGFAPNPSQLRHQPASETTPERVWVALHHLREGFGSGGPGRLVSVDPDNDAVAARVTLPERANCGPMALDGGAPEGASGEGLWVACTGVFADGAEGQAQRAGLVHLTLNGDEAVVDFERSGAELVGGPLGFQLLPIDRHRVAVVALGDLVTGRVDRVFEVDRRDGSTRPLGVEAPAYELGTLMGSPAASMLLMATADPVAPSVRRFGWTPAGVGAELSPVDVNPSVGLAPRHLAEFRPCAPSAPEVP